MGSSTVKFDCKSNLERFKAIMDKYKHGEFGVENLSMYDVFEKANSLDVIESLSITEIQELLNTSTGMTKMMFSALIKEKMKNLSERAKERKTIYPAIKTEADAKVENDNFSDLEYCIYKQIIESE